MKGYKKLANENGIQTPKLVNKIIALGGYHKSTKIKLKNTLCSTISRQYMFLKTGLINTHEATT